MNQADRKLHHVVFTLILTTRLGVSSNGTICPASRLSVLTKITYQQSILSSSQFFSILFWVTKSITIEIRKIRWLANTLKCDQNIIQQSLILVRFLFQHLTTSLGYYIHKLSGGRHKHNSVWFSLGSENTSECQINIQQFHLLEGSIFRHPTFLLVTLFFLSSLFPFSSFSALKINLL